MIRLTTLFLICILAALNGTVFSEDAIPVDVFSDSINHYRHEVDGTDYDRYEPGRISEIAGNILLYQRENGGWPKNWDPLRILSSDETVSVRAQKNLEDTTFDNRSTYTQIAYLAEAFYRTGDTIYRDAAMKGIDFILKAQYENGGWPQFWPDMSGYRSQITLNDDVLTGLLFFLRETQTNKTVYGFLPEETNNAIRKSLRNAESLILRLQVVVDGKRTVWAGQYDHESLEPATARSYELPCLISAESVNVVRYLMQAETPTPEIIDAISSAVAWYEKSKIFGIRVETFEIPPVKHGKRTITTDKRVVEVPNAPPIWARFYEIDTNRPFMANRDGSKVYSLAEVEHERRIGYGWYTYAPAKLLEKDYPEWCERLKQGKTP